MTDDARVRSSFRAATEAFVTVVDGIPAQDWGSPGLGTWTVRELVGHTSRALLTVESYLGIEAPSGAARLDDAVAYYLAAGAVLADPAAVAERGRAAAAALGADPAATVHGLAERVLALVSSSADAADVSTPVGTMALTSYLPSRTFELCVHTLDLVRATGVEQPPALSVAVGPCLQLAAGLAAHSGRAAHLLLALTGREPLVAGFSVV